MYLVLDTTEAIEDNSTIAWFHCKAGRRIEEETLDGGGTRGNKSVRRGEQRAGTKRKHSARMIIANRPISLRTIKQDLRSQGSSTCGQDTNTANEGNQSCAHSPGQYRIRIEETVRNVKETSYMVHRLVNMVQCVMR